MAYSTPEEVRLALVPTSDGSLPATPTHTAADLADAQINDAITEADALIDGYIGNFYAVPVAPNTDSSIPSPVGYWSRSIAAYLVTLTYRGSLDIDAGNPVVLRYRDILASLKQVATGQLKLQLPLNVSPNAAAGAGDPYNPYCGDLWVPEDFDIYPRNNWPTGMGGFPYGYWQDFT